MVTYFYLTLLTLLRLQMSVAKIGSHPPGFKMKLVASYRTLKSVSNPHSGHDMETGEDPDIRASDLRGKFTCFGELSKATSSSDESVRKGVWNSLSLQCGEALPKYVVKEFAEKGGFGVFATRTIRKGNAIMTETPFVIMASGRSQSLSQRQYRTNT